MGEDGINYEQQDYWDFLNGDDGVRGTADDRCFATSSMVPESLRSGIPGVSVTNEISWLTIIIRAKRGLSIFELRALVSMQGKLPSNRRTEFERFNREEPVFSIEDDTERSEEISNLNYPFAVVEIQENEIVL